MLKTKTAGHGDILLTPSWRYDTRKGSLVHRDGREIFLEHRLKPFFAMLAAHRNDVVTRGELMEFAWKDVVVNDDSVTKAASDLRKCLSRNGVSDFHLVTVSKLGYKLDVPGPAGTVWRRPVRTALRLAGFAVLAIVLFIILVRAISY